MPEEISRDEINNSAVNVDKAEVKQSEPQISSHVFVIPGEMIGTSEEFVPGINTFEYGGNIYSTATGLVNINRKTHTISVTPKTSTPPSIKKGDVVIGRVNDIKSSLALVEIASIVGKGEREIVNLQQAAVHISNVKDSYVKDIMYELQPFDIIKAQVIDLKTMRLTTAGKDLGVIKAYCGRCRMDMIKHSNNGNESNKLKCPVCGKIESRKLSSEYGIGIV